MLFRHHRVIERVVFVIKFNDRAGQLRALLDAQTCGQRTCCHIADHNLERNDLHFADQLLAHIEPFDEMGRHTDLVEIVENIFRDAVVQHAFAINHLVLFGIEGGGIIFEMLDQGAGFRTFVKDLGLALVNATTTIHRF